MTDSDDRERIWREARDATLADVDLLIGEVIEELEEGYRVGKAPELTFAIRELQHLARRINDGLSK